jgi:uncharacterized protein YutE (UPF0331/DUF86 family)
MKLKIDRITNELGHMKNTLRLMQSFLEKEKWNEAETAGMGTFLGNLYTGYENIFRSFLEEKGISITKGERWHIDLLGKATEENFVPLEMQKTLQGMLAYRHLQIHGYGYMLQEELIRENSAQAIKTFSIFEEHIHKILNQRETSELI